MLNYATYNTTIEVSVSLEDLVREHSWNSGRSHKSGNQISLAKRLVESSEFTGVGVGRTDAELARLLFREVLGQESLQRIGFVERFFEHETLDDTTQVVLVHVGFLDGLPKTHQSS